MVNGSCIVVIPVNNVEDGVARRYARGDLRTEGGIGRQLFINTDRRSLAA
jgi:hypothetical protein